MGVTRRGNESLGIIEPISAVAETRDGFMLGPPPLSPPRKGRGSMCGRGRCAYFFVPKSTRGVWVSCGGMSNVAIGWAEEYMTERQMRPGKVVSSVL